MTIAKPNTNEHRIAGQSVRMTSYGHDDLVRILEVYPQVIAFLEARGDSGVIVKQLRGELQVFTGFADARGWDVK